MFYVRVNKISETKVKTKGQMTLIIEKKYKQKKKKETKRKNKIRSVKNAIYKLI